MLDATGGTAAPLADCPLPSKKPGGIPKVTPLVGVLVAADCPVCQVPECSDSMLDKLMARECLDQATTESDTSHFSPPSAFQRRMRGV